MNMRTKWIPIAFALGACAAMAGTPCPDPFTYHVVNGLCMFSNCVSLPPGGYVVSPGTYLDGGCRVPGHSAKTCSTRTWIVDWTRAEGSSPFENGCGESVYASCTTHQVNIYGIVEGYSTTTNCPYDCHSGS
jgi:hypothetical protein